MSPDAWAAMVWSVIIALFATYTRPTHGRCPAYYDLRTGIRISGDYECWPNIAGDPLYDGAGGYPERGRQGDGILRGQIYCTGGSYPIVVDDRTVGCQR